MMGARLKIENETTFAHEHDEEKRLINLDNWRAICEGKYSGVDGLYVIHPSFRMYFLFKFTTAMFHEANYCNKHLDIPYEYIKNVLSCNKCFGNGKVDWIEAARGAKPKHVKALNLKFIRAKTKPINIMRLYLDQPSYQVSLSYTKRGEEICKKCCGSGLHLAETSLIEKTITIENYRKT
jgi:hypothetical protein